MVDEGILPLITRVHIVSPFPVDFAETRVGRGLQAGKPPLSSERGAASSPTLPGQLAVCPAPWLLRSGLFRPLLEDGGGQPPTALASCLAQLMGTSRLAGGMGAQAWSVCVRSGGGQLGGRPAVPGGPWWLWAWCLCSCVPMASCADHGSSCFGCVQGRPCLSCRRGKGW